jgi:hypothetical protein
MKNSILRTLLFSLTILSLLLFRPVQNADAKQARPRPPSSSKSFVLSDVCEFDVLVNELTNREFFTTFFAQGRQPNQDAHHRIANVSAHEHKQYKWMEVNISGPDKITLNEDGTETHYSGGTWLIAMFPTDVPDFQARVFLISVGWFLRSAVAILRA